MSPPPLDLHTLSLLFAYEVTSYEPRFRHAKLTEACLTSARKPVTFAPTIPTIKLSKVDTAVQRRFRFDVDSTPSSSSSSNEPDSPSTMLPSPVPHNRGLDSLAPKDVDDIFHEVRQHNGCYRAASLLQHFFDLYPPSHPLLIRTAKGDSFTIPISRRVIYEWKLHTPKTTTAAMVFPQNQTHITGGNLVENHSTIAFSPEGEQFCTHVLDLSSMQFGPKGRGQGGEPFWLGTMDDWHDELMAGVSDGGAENFRGAGSMRVAPTTDKGEDAFHRRVVEKVKKRWDAGVENDKGCAACGKPDAKNKCACGEVWYCGKEHQTRGWKFHRNYCKAKGKK